MLARGTTPQACIRSGRQVGRCGWHALVLSHILNQYAHYMTAATGSPATASGLDDQGQGRRRWLVLLIGMIAMTAGCTFQYGLGYLIPALRREGMSLELAGLLVACPTAGLLLTLVAWGAAADRWGERLVLGSGLALAGIVLLAGGAARGTAALGACLLLAGAAGASVYAASGRLILGWFAGHERGPGHGHPAGRPAAGRGGRRAFAAVARGPRSDRPADLPRRVLPGGRVPGRDRGPRPPAADGAGGREARITLPGADPVAHPRRQCPPGRPAVHRGHVRAGLPGGRARMAR